MPGRELRGVGDRLLVDAGAEQLGEPLDAHVLRHELRQHPPLARWRALREDGSRGQPEIEADKNRQA